MEGLTRKARAQGVRAQLRGVGPQTVAEIQGCLGLTKREVEDALYLLMGRGDVEYDWPTRSPLVYRAVERV